MITDAHTKKEPISIVTLLAGDNIIISALPNAWIYIHELIGDLDADDTLQIKAGTRVLATFDLAAGQGFSTTDEPGNDGVPRFECRPGEDFILNIAGGAIFSGNVHYSLRF